MQRTAAPLRLSNFARRLLAEWKRLDLTQGDVQTETHIVVGVSGGADSLALLLALDELRKARRLRLSITVAHLNHALRGAESAADAETVRGVAAALGCEAAIEMVDVAALATRTKDNLEQAARRARYEFLHATAGARGAAHVLTAHTLDDQAETFLLRMVRGSGAEGLGAMRAVRPLQDASTGQHGVQDGREATAEASDETSARTLLVRPLLGWARRGDTEEYCRVRGQPFLHDEMNDDLRFARVRVRRELLPLLRAFNPRIEETLTRTAALLRDDATALERCAAILLDEAVSTHFAGEAPTLAIAVLKAAPPALQRRALRLWLKDARGHLRRIDEVHVRAVQSLLAGERGGRVAELPGGGRVERRRGELRFLPSTAAC